MLSPEDWDRVTEDEGFVVFILRLQYVDVFGSAYEMACRYYMRVDLGGAQLAINGGRAYNYLRRIDDIAESNLEYGGED